MLLPALLIAFALSTSQNDIQRNIKGHFHHGHPKPEQLPSFLRNVSTEAQNEFFEIVRDRKTPRREIKERMEKWAEEQGESVVEELHSFDAKKAARFAEIHRNVSKAISDLPSAHEQVHKIVMDDSLSKDQMIEKLRALKVDPALGRSLRGIMFAVAHPRMPHGKPHSTHRNSSHPSAYEGLGPLAVVLGHGGKGDGMLPIGAEDHEHKDFV